MATTKILRVIICSGTMQLEKKKDFYKVITPYIAELSSCGALPRCNPTTLNSRNLRRLIVSFEEDVAPDLDLKLVQKCRVRLAVLEKLYNAVEILELQGFRVAAKFLSATRILIAVPSLALAKEVNKILLAMPRIASSFLYDVQRYSRDVHKRFIVSQENCIVVISDPLTNKASAIEISGIDLVICYDVPKTAFRKVSKWKGSIYVLLTDVENRDVDNEEFIYKAYDFFAITREMRRYVLNSAEKINDFLCEVGITISPQRSEIDTDGVGTQVSGTATSTSPISLAGTDGPLQNTENPLISSKQSCTTLIIQAIPDTATEASAGLGVANTEEATRRDLCLESAELFNAVVTPIARKRLPATSTPFEGAALMHRIPDNLTPLRPHQVRVNRGNRVALREVETMDSTGGRSRLGVTALVNIVQKRKKQKKLQHFFKAQMKPEKRLSNICESILILSQDDNKNDTSSNVERAYIPEAGALIPENNFQQNSHLISNNELVFDPDEHRQPTSNQKESIHSTAVSHNYSQNNINDRELSHDGHVEIDQVNPVESDSSGEGNTYIFNEINKDELVFDPHEHHHLTSNQKESIHSTIVSHDYSPNNINDRKLSHDGHVEIDQVNPVESDSCGEDTYIFNEINEDEIAKRVDPEMEEPLGPFSLCESIDGAESLGSNFFYKASKKVETSKAIVRDLTEVDKQIFDKNFVSAVQKKSASGSPMNKSPTAININDDTFERIDKQANVCSSRNRQIQKQMFRKDVLTETRTNNIPGCSKQKAFVVKQFRSVFDALNEHEKAVKPQESVKSMFDIINKMTTRDEEAELKVNFVEKPAEVGNIFTKEFEEELRTTDEQQRTQEMKRFENIEEDSEDIFNEIVESCLAKNKADAPVQQNVVTDWKSSQKKAFAKQKTETIQESSYEISPCKLLPITIASRELKNTTLGKKESVGSCSDDKSPLLLEDRLKPKKLSLVEKLRLGCRKSLVLQKQEALLAEHGGAGFHITQESSENKSAESGDFQAKTSSSENEMSNIERRNFREQKTYDRNWSCLSDSVDSKNGNTYKQFNANRPDKEALRQVTEPTVHLKDGTMSDIFEGFCKHRRKKPRCEFLEEEAELDLLNYEAVSTDEDENETDTYENNSFVDDTSLTAQSQGMYLELNARLSPREGRLSPCSTRNPLPIKECYSETPTDDDDMSYDSQDSFIVKGDVPDVTLPLEITVMRRASTLSTAKTHRGDVRKCDKARRNKCTKRRRVFLLSASDKNEASTSASSEYSPDKDSSTTVSKIDMTT
ncbi:hypothetical protein BIW11_00339 [Tropilaelaps mercedesae]|uniref:Uncharacterized protein n=1 Tax=Tropilaelaps mercedesae TaxID=418985 RepID=A0A1V9XXN9_9ACAR|nr:hypothetical protein BIW11_00339 [Tropilaelaps mercedesae]